MKYRRSCYAKSATVVSLALVLTLTACIPAGPQSGTSTGRGVSEVSMAAIEPLATVVDQQLPSPEPNAANTLNAPVLLEVPSAVIVPATGAAPAIEDSGTGSAVAPTPAASAPQVAAAPAVTTPLTAPPADLSVGPGSGECTPDNIDIQRDDQVRAIKPIPAGEQQYYTVLGCAEGWLAYSISDEGIKAIGLDGGNAWYGIATLQSNGRYLDDHRQVFSSVYNWEFLGYDVQNGKYATVQEGMDHEFATKGIPVRLREKLVGPGPAAPEPGGPTAGECAPANIDIQRQDQARAIKPIPAGEQQYYTVLGCAEGWLAYSISGEGIKAIGLDGGNAWYRIARLQSSGRYLDEYGEVYSSVHTWEFLAFDVQAGKYATVQDAMDDQFSTNGIPVRLREQLVGHGPATSTP
uniref:SH3 domain-containing protein n=2 Tax=Paenarthrobacter nicotinovorans TaxID=29320 RepID=Q8GAM6_PAENI|nr:hypothetical protein [Paenarthrobacter nicotinovorans]